jgi:hypothetical protein
VFIRNLTGIDLKETGTRWLESLLRGLEPLRQWFESLFNWVNSKIDAIVTIARGATDAAKAVLDWTNPNIQGTDSAKLSQENASKIINSETSVKGGMDIKVSLAENLNAKVTAKSETKGFEINPSLGSFVF